MAVITIASAVVPSWNAGSDVQLRIYALENFIAADGAMLIGGPVSSDSSLDGNFCIEIGCTLSGALLTIASFPIESTTDSQDNPSATYGAYFFTNEGEMICPFGEFASFQLPSSPTSTTWQAIALAQGKGNS